ncbi:MAG: (d)CMP kinase [Eubacteriales bacterium]|nr:(d)CMP kinase [Eubacteriales bacterium]
MINAIAIDGPSGAGKTSLAKALAKKLGLRYMDTGAMYRAYAAAAIRRGLDPKDPEAAEELLLSCKLSLDYENGEQVTRVNGEDMRPYLRSPEVSKAASDLSTLPLVRMALVSYQQALARQGSYVLEGRDIGTVVLPNASVKFFLTAGEKERIERRFKQYQEEGKGKSLAEVENELKYRDKQDSEREASPLKAADDAIIIDSSKLSFSETLELMLEEVKQRGNLSS